MSLERFQPPTIRNLAIAGVVGLAFVALFAFLPEVIKVLGAPFLYIPSRLGVVDWVSGDDVRVLNLTLSEPTARLDLMEPGPYLVYTRNTDLLELARGDGLARFTITNEATGEPVPTAPIQRGLRPWDTPFARGRPIHRFEIERSGDYVLTLRFGRPVTLSVVPDYLNGREKTIQLAYVLEAGVILVVLAAIYVPRYRTRRRLIRASQKQKRERYESFWAHEREERRDK